MGLDCGVVIMFHQQVVLWNLVLKADFIYLYRKFCQSIYQIERKRTKHTNILHIIMKGIYNGRRSDQKCKKRYSMSINLNALFLVIFYGVQWNYEFDVCYVCIGPLRWFYCKNDAIIISIISSKYKKRLSFDVYAERRWRHFCARVIILIMVCGSCFQYLWLAFLFQSIQCIDWYDNMCYHKNGFIICVCLSRPLVMNRWLYDG